MNPLFWQNEAKNCSNFEGPKSDAIIRILMTTGGLKVENVGRPEPLILDSSATLAWIYADEVTEASCR